MTFIASVIAKNGVAVIADSLVTTSEPVINTKDFFRYMKTKQTNGNGSIQLEVDELIGLFRSRASYTKDYEEKLFQFDSHTAITTSGAAEINDKRIAEIVKGIIDKNKKDNGYKSKKIETKVKGFCDYLTTEVKSHLNKHDRVFLTTFIITHFNKNQFKTSIFRVTVGEAERSDLNNPEKVFVSYTPAHEIETVVCDGNNRIAQDILFGKLPFLDYVVEEVLKQVAVDLKMTFLPTYSQGVKNGIYHLTGAHDDFKIAKLKNLSLQQAVDLANLLMKIEMDIQKYTEDIPTVGGVIKIAIIDSTGFKFVAGHEIINPLPHT